MSSTCTKWLALLVAASLFFVISPGPATAEVPGPTPTGVSWIEMNRQAAEHWLDPLIAYSNKCTEIRNSDEDTDPYMVVEDVRRKNGRGWNYYAGGVQVPEPERLRNGKYWQRFWDFPENCYVTYVDAGLNKSSHWDVRVERMSQTDVGLVHVLLPLLDVIDITMLLSGGATSAFKLARAAYRSVMGGVRTSMAAAKARSLGKAGILQARRSTLSKVAEEVKKAGSKSQDEIDRIAVKSAEDHADEAEQAAKAEGKKVTPAPSIASTEIKNDLTESIWRSLPVDNQLTVMQVAAGIVSEFDPFTLKSVIGMDLDAVTTRALRQVHVALVAFEFVRTGSINSAIARAKKLGAARGVSPRSSGLPGGMFRPGGSPTGGRKGAGYWGEESTVSNRNDPQIAPLPPVGESLSKAARLIPEIRTAPPSAPGARGEIADKIIKMVDGNKETVGYDVATSVRGIEFWTGQSGEADIGKVLTDPKMAPVYNRPNTDLNAQREAANNELNAPGAWRDIARKDPSNPAAQAAISLDVDTRVRLQTTAGNMGRAAENFGEHHYAAYDPANS